VQLLYVFGRHDRLTRRNQGDGQAQFLRKLAAEIMEQNSNQHGLTQKAAKEAAREQVGFNLAGYLDDFSKALSVRVERALHSMRRAKRELTHQGEVRVLLKEVGDLRESRRALYMCVSLSLWLGAPTRCTGADTLREIADLLLMKGRQSAG
jgi:hypothetical protein